MNKHCENHECCKPIVRRRNESKHNYNRRKWCSADCKKIVREKKIIKRLKEQFGEDCLRPVKQCPVCGGDFSKRDNQPLIHYAKQEACNRKCGGIYAAKLRKGELKRPPFNPTKQVKNGNRLWLQALYAPTIT